MENDKKQLLRETVQHYFVGVPDTPFDINNWIQDGVLEVEDYMCIEEIGFLIDQYRNKKNGLPLKITFPNGDKINN
ncbi:hypothetical protein ABUJ24_27295 [Klebsiella pneumoniae]|uniref:hypothetical protein n=1 Tax=Klebsiella pneumoniae TaxID=573 RepID=UPI00333DE58B